jgi:hypothetical protein
MMTAGGDSGHLPPFKSEQKDWAQNSNLEFFDFVPLRGGKGGRVVIDRLIIRLTGTITVAAANFDGRDVARLFQNIIVEQRDGRQRWNLSGFKSRQASIILNGIERHAEHADIAIGAGATVDFRLVIPMAKRYTRRPKDFSLPADVLRKVILQCGTYAGAATGATVLSAADLDVYVCAEWHEEDSVEIKSEDSVKSIDFTSNTQAKTSLSGTVHDMWITRETTTAGGGVITGITDARCDELGIPVLTRSDLAHSYTEKRAIAPSGLTTGAERFNDPVRQGTVLPLVAATPETSVWDGKLVDTLKVDVGTGAANLSLVTREVLKKSQENFNAQAAMFGIKPSELRMKTALKSKRGFDEHRDPRAVSVAPWSAKLR